jgi:hypothetical protein
MQLAQTPPCGIALTSYVENGNLNVTAHCGFNTTLSGGDYRISIFLTEDGVTGYPQSNYYNDGTEDPNSPFIGLGDPIVDFVHNHVVRTAVTEGLGDIIPAASMIPGGEFVITKSAPIDGYVINNLRIVAFINLVGPDANGHQVMNAQQANVYEIKDWD